MWREKRTIEVKFLFLFAEIRHVSVWQTLRDSVLFKLFSAETMGTVTIFSHFHLAKSDYGSWPKLGVTVFTDFHHQDFSTTAVDTQE